jgi:hypothetical protein
MQQTTLEPYSLVTVAVAAAAAVVGNPESKLQDLVLADNVNKD